MFNSSQIAIPLSSGGRATKVSWFSRDRCSCRWLKRFYCLQTFFLIVSALKTLTLCQVCY